MEDLLCGDIRYLLSEILENKDLWLLCKTFPNNEKLNKRLIELINKKCITEMMNRMRKLLGKELEEFINLLNEVGATISGSFIIQCLLNEDWNTDIDIFVPMKGNIISKTPSDNPTSLVDSFLNERFTFKDYIPANRYNNFIDNKIKWVRSFGSISEMNTNKIDFQVILVDIEKDEMKDFILQNFDFDIIKNTYLRNEIKIYNYEDIFSKTTNFKIGNRLGSSISRCIRYEEKGFKFLNKEITREQICNIQMESVFMETLPIKIYGEKIVWDYYKDYKDKKEVIIKVQYKNRYNENIIEDIHLKKFY